MAKNIMTLKEIKEQSKKVRDHPSYDPERAEALGYSPAAIMKRVLKTMKLVATGVRSPVGRVEKGSRVHFTYQGKPSLWIDGNVYTRKDK